VSSDAKAHVAKEAGANHVVNYRTEDVGARVREITEGRGVDRIIEVDFGANVETNASCLKPNGTVASYSSTRVRTPTLPYYDFALKGARLHLLQAANFPASLLGPATNTIIALLERGRLRPRIAKRFTLDQIAEAHELVEAGEAVGNVVVEME
jgi:NADPH2:quinone reductase